jgi:fucose 4-O-acetylase-like acetyltransferase
MQLSFIFALPAKKVMSRMLPPDAPARRMAQPPFPPVSQAIGLARLICILGIVYVHAWTGLGGDEMAAQMGSAQDILRWTVVELFGRGAVPLLSMVSGWLVAGSLAKRGAKPFLGSKARTVLVPMVLWNAIAMVLVVGVATIGWVRAPLLGDAAWIADNLFSLARAGDINVQTAFLRDLFVCMLAAPLLVRLSTRWLLLVGAAAALWWVSLYQVPLLLRPSILLFFVGGILVRRHRLAERAALLPPWQAALPFLLVVPFKIWLSIENGGMADFHLHATAAVDLLTRAAAALLVWRSAIALAGRPVAGRLLGLERYAFFLFCCHLLFMWLVAPEIGALTGTMGSPLWPAFFLLQPLLALGFAILLAKAIEALAPKAAELLSGGRLGRDQATSPAARPLAQAHWKL